MISNKKKYSDDFCDMAANNERLKGGFTCPRDSTEVGYGIENPYNRPRDVDIFSQEDFDKLKLSTKQSNDDIDAINIHFKSLKKLFDGILISLNTLETSYSDYDEYSSYEFEEDLFEYSDSFSD